jgi:hypothetical protein
MNMKEEYKTKELANRWIELLRSKAGYEHEERKKGKVVASPSIDDICNEMIAYFTGIID